MSSDELQTLTARLDRIERLTLLGAKDCLDIKEAADYTGYSTGYLYRLTSTCQIPHYKKNAKVYFDKGELKSWLLAHPVKTQAAMKSEAETYCATHNN